MTARPAPVSTNAADITLIDGHAEQLRRPQSLADVLRFQPALYIGQMGQRGGLTSVSLRGGDANFTLVMVDGVPVNDTTDQLGGTVDLSTILPLNLSRVEVVRGPLSAVYGSEAVAGVVNVVTGDEGQPRWTVRLGGGNFGTFEGGMGAAGRAGRVRYNLGIGGLRIGEQVDRDSYEAVDSSGRAVIDLSKLTSLTLHFRGRQFESTGFPASSGGTRFALNRELETRKAVSGLGGFDLRHTTERWSHQLQTDVFQQGQDQDTPTIFDGFPPSFQTVPATVSDTLFRRTRVNGSSSVQLGHGFTATAGGAYRREYGENLGSIAFLGPTEYQLRRNTGAAFAETILDRGSWSAIAGVRSDWVTGDVQRWSPRLGASALLPWKGARARASWGRGFKMPSFYALAHPFIGNPALLPESSEAADVAIEQALGRRMGVVSANFFRSTYTNLVDFSALEFRLVNRSRALSRGVDLAWRWRLPARASLQAHGTYNSVFLENTPEPLRGRPRWRTGTTLSMPLGSRSTFSVEGLWVSSRYDFQIPLPERDRAGSYFLGNLSASHAITDGLTAFVRIDNLLNRRYEEFLGFPNPGVQARGGVEYRLR